jgi:hypothetical protein
LIRAAVCSFRRSSTIASSRSCKLATTHRSLPTPPATRRRGAASSLHLLLSSSSSLKSVNCTPAGSSSRPSTSLHQVGHSHHFTKSANHHHQVGLLRLILNGPSPELQSNPLCSPDSLPGGGVPPPPPGSGVPTHNGHIRGGRAMGNAVASATSRRIPCTCARGIGHPAGSGLLGRPPHRRPARVGRGHTPGATAFPTSPGPRRIMA